MFTIMTCIDIKKIVQMKFPGDWSTKQSTNLTSACWQSFMLLFLVLVHNIWRRILEFKNWIESIWALSAFLGKCHTKIHSYGPYFSC